MALFYGVIYEEFERHPIGPEFRKLSWSGIVISRSVSISIIFLLKPLQGVLNPLQENLYYLLSSFGMSTNSEAD